MRGMSKNTNILLLVLLSWSLAACSGQSAQSVIVIVPGDPAAATQNALTGVVNPGGDGQSAAQSQPLPIATPSTPPDVLLQLADRYLINGYYEDAVASYQMILAQGDAVPADIRATATFSWGQAAVREGLFDQAVTAMTAFIGAFPADVRTPQAYFLRGDAYSGLSLWNEAIADYQQYLALRPGLIDSYAHERIGDAQLALGLTDLALVSYAQAINTGRTRVPLVALRERLATRYRAVGRSAEALAQYEAILAVAENDGYRAQIEFEVGQTLLDAGQRETGLRQMQRIFDSYPATAFGYNAMEVLLDNGVALDNYSIGRVSYFYGDYPRAIEALTTYTTQVPLSDIPAELHMLLGRAYRAIENSAAADVAFRTVVEQYPSDPLFGDALLERGRTRFLAGDIPGAIEQYLLVADTYGYLGATAAEALWRVGYLYGTNEDPQQARVYFLRLADAYPTTEQAISGLFIAASQAYNAGESTVAESLYARIAATAAGEDQAAAYMWVGRLALDRGDSAVANDAFQRVISIAPESYFAARSRDILTGVQPFQPPATYQFEFDDAAQIAEAEAWLRGRFPEIATETPEGELWRAPAELTADPNLVRGLELWAVAAYDEAEDEFFAVIEVHEADALRSYQLAILLRGIGAYYPSIFAAANVILAAGTTTLEAPAYIARMRYPVYYLEVVQAAAERHNFDPLLLYSLIRQESLFNTNATAAAGEKGLTQVIPSTAEYIAGVLDWPDYQHSDLFRPYAGIEFGGYFLSEQLVRFDGNALAALAGYNAGPGRAIDWLALSGDDPDLFMSIITIDTTRVYVQRIYNNYGIYRALYGGA